MGFRYLLLNNIQHLLNCCSPQLYTYGRSLVESDDDDDDDDGNRVNWVYVTHTTRTLYNLDAGNSFVVHLHSASVGIVYRGKNKNIKNPKNSISCKSPYSIRTVIVTRSLGLKLVTVMDNNMSNFHSTMDSVVRTKNDFYCEDGMYL